MIDDGGAMSRRAMLRGGFARAITGGAAEPAPSRREHPHRPPGAVDEPEFALRCTGCGDCARACPAGAVMFEPGVGGRSSLAVIRPALAACIACVDTPCVAACGAEALRPDLPKKMGTARINPDDCLAYQGSFCSVCAERCPVPGAILVERGRPFVEESRCTGCGTCVFVCPAPRVSVRIDARRGRS